MLAIQLYKSSKSDLVTSIIKISSFFLKIMYSILFMISLNLKLKLSINYTCSFTLPSDIPKYTFLAIFTKRPVSTKPGINKSF